MKYSFISATSLFAFSLAFVRIWSSCCITNSGLGAILSDKETSQ